MAKNNGSKSAAAEPRRARLADMVGSLLEAASEANSEARLGLDTMFLGRYVGEANLGATSAVVADIANAILAELGPSHGFQGSWEILSYCLDRLQDIQEEDPDYEVDAARAAIADHLPTPKREYSFEVSYPTSASLAMEWELGGPHSLAVSVAPRENKAPLLTLVGSVKAATREGAILNSERIIDAVLGAMRTIGIARFIDSRSPVAKRPDILITSISPKRGQDDFRSPAAALYGDRLASIFFGLPVDLSDLEKAVLGSGDAAQALARHRRSLAKVLAGTSQRAQEVRNACRLAINAEHSLDFGVLVTLAFSCLEGLLLQSHVTESVLARLAEAVAHSLGGSVEEKDELRKLVKKLYDVRSQFVHTGMAGEAAGARDRALRLMYRVLGREVEALPDITE